MSKQWVVYMLKLSNGAFYTGITNDLEARLAKHRSGKGSKYVRSHLPLKLVYIVKVSDKSAALKLEARIKKLNHIRKITLANEQGVRK